MEKLDQDLQKRVWQRVQGKNTMPPLGKVNCKSWMLTAQENASTYQSLSQRLSGREGEQMKRLHQESMKCIACMKGICRLRGENFKLGPLPQERAPQRKLLEGCYRRERQLWEEFERHGSDADHGIVFGRLAQQAQEHCVTIMEILGKL